MAYNETPYTNDDELFITFLNALNENFRKLKYLIVPPPSLDAEPETGEIGYDRSSGLHKRYNGTSWVNSDCSDFIGDVMYSEDVADIVTALGGLAAIITGAGGAAAVRSAIGVGMDSGTTYAVFVQDSAPTGWTIASGFGDTLIAVKGGSQAYNASGGTVVGTWTQPNHEHSTNVHVPTIAEMTTHRHAVYGVKYNVAMDNYHSISAIEVGVGGDGPYYTENTGGGQGHDHGNVNGGATVNSWRPYASLSIVCKLS